MPAGHWIWAILKNWTGERAFGALGIDMPLISRLATTLLNFTPSELNLLSTNEGTAASANTRRVDEKGGVWVRVGGGVAPATVQRKDKFASDRYAESSSSDDGNEEEPKTITLDLSSVVGGLSSASNPAGESEN